MGICIKLLGGYLFYDKLGLLDYELWFRFNKYLLIGVLNYVCVLGLNLENLVISFWNGFLFLIFCRILYIVY